MNLLKPGAYARDKVTGFEGVITALHQELGEPNQLRCQFRLEASSRDGKPGESQWFDVARVERARKENTQASEAALKKDDAALADTPKAEEGRISIKDMIDMLMSMGIAKAVRVGGCSDPGCPLCIAVREAQKPR